MKLTKRIIAMVLCLLMISSGTVNVLATENPDIVVAENPACAECDQTEGHMDTCSLYEAPASPCPTCGVEGCTSGHENWCVHCKVDNCGQTHVKCDKCLTTDCKNPHEQWCEHCRQDNCGKTHVVCDECSTVDGHLDACTKNAPAESTKCDLCSIENGHAEGCPAVTPCATCGQLRCLVTHENWCAVCNTENCGQTHVTCDECTGVDGHNDGCSKKETTPVGCPDCGEAEGHKDTCPQYVAPVVSVFDQLMAAESTEEMYLAMLALMDSDLDGLLALTRAEIAQLRTRVSELDPNGEFTDTQDLLDTLAVLPNGGETESAYELIDAATSLEEMWVIMFAEENAEGVDALSYVEIEDLRHKANGYYCHLEFPTENETYWYSSIENMLNDLVYNLSMDGISLYAENWSGRQEGFTHKIDDRVINLTGNVTLGGLITVSGGTLTITTSGNYAITRSSGLNFFKVTGGKLIIKGSNGNKITIKGNTDNGNLNSAAIYATGGTLEVKDAIIEDCKNTNDANSWGAAFYFEKNINANIENTIIRNCQAGNGSALYFNANCNGTINVKNSTIINCKATTGEYDGTIRTMGNTSCKLTIESCTIKNNTSGLNGGGVYWNARGTGAKLTIQGTTDKPTVIEGNSADNGGGIFLSGSEITISNTRIVDNKAKNGGGICMQPYDVYGTSDGSGCTLILNAGAQLLNNVAENYGGGVYMEIDSGSTTQGEKFTINVNDGALVQGNKAPNGGGIAITQTTGNAEYTQGADRMYHAYVNINGGTIKDNTASVNGGAVYINRTNYGTSAYDLHVKIAGGEIVGNKATENGGTIYVANDTRSNYSKVVVSGGTAKSNSAKNGGTVYLQGGNFEMSGGTFEGNTASASGGGVYVNDGKYDMTGGTLTGNNAAKNGGAAYVSGGTFTMGGGVMQKNTAAESGGAAYINNGDFIMNNGTLGGENLGNNAANGGAVYVNGGQFNMSNGNATHNSAANGGAVYMAKGSMTIKHGILNHNRATLGGAVYMDGDENTNLIMESGQMSYNNAAEDGGAIYATSGTIKIGLENCLGDEGNQTYHTAKGAGRYHPLIQENTAGDTGGGISIEGKGKVHLYCVNATQNEASYRGVGNNIFMKGGELYIHDGANVGVPRDPDLVIIGGELWNECKNTQYITLRYYESNDSTTTEMIGLAEAGRLMNLPDGEYFWPSHAGEDLVFLGWTAQGAASGTQVNSFVRHKDQYIDSGAPVEILDDTPPVRNEFDDAQDEETYNNTVKMFDGVKDNTIHLYALWAPKTSSISYKNGLTGEAIPSKDTDPDTYSFSRDSHKLLIQPVEEPGYDLVGWYIYQDANQNANWNDTLADYEAGKYEPNNDVASLHYLELDTPNTALELEAGLSNFGNITMIAKYEEQIVEINYELVFIDGCDGGAELSLYSEEILRKNGTAQGSTPTVEPGYKFVGWFTDDNCTTPVESNWVDNTTNKLTPEKEGDNQLYEARTYYARIEWDYVDVVIKVQEGAESFPTSHTPVTVVFTGTRADNNETITLNVAFGSGDTQVTVKSVPVGTYQAYAKDDWAWRYDSDGPVENLMKDGQNIKDADQRTFVVKYTDNTNDLWLNGYGHAKK